MDELTKNHIKVFSYFLTILYVIAVTSENLKRLARLIEGMERSMNV